MASEDFNATLISRHDLNEELSIVRIRPDSGEVPPFIPGQFAMVALPKNGDSPDRGGVKPKGSRMIRRAYSIASSPLEAAYVELLVVLVKEGRLTPKLWTVETGGRLWLDDRIKGNFTLDGIGPEKNLVMVATGTGLAPFVSMLRTYAGQKRWNRLALIHGVRYACDLAYGDELAQFGRCDPSVAYVPTASREPDDSAWHGLRGRVQVVLGDDATFESGAGFKLDPDNCHVLLCGNPDMITSVEAGLHARGFTTQTRDTPGTIHFERYW